MYLTYDRTCGKIKTNRKGVFILEGLVMIAVMALAFWMVIGAPDKCEGDEIERKMDLEALKKLKKGKMR